MTDTTGFWLDSRKLSGLAISGLRDTIIKARHSHIADVILRLNGQDVRLQADWIKYLVECPDGGCGRYPDCPCGKQPSDSPPERRL